MTETSASAAPPAHANRILLVLALAALTVSFIETMLTPALPRLATFFSDAPYTTVAWIISAYLLVGVATIPIFAKLGDLYGKRRVLGIVLSIYAVAVALAPLTPAIGSALGLSRAASIYLLIATRGLQGVGLAMFPLALAMLAEALPADRVAPAQGVVASLFAVGSSFGIALGSWIVQAFDWQVAYALVLPLAAALPFLARFWLPTGRHGTGGRLDLVGAGLLGGGLASFLLALTLGPTWGWTSWTGGSRPGLPLGTPELLLLAASLLVLFVVRSWRNPEPLIDLARFRDRNFALAYTGAMLVGLALFTGFVVLTVLVEFPIVGLGESVLSFGILSIPTTVTMFVAAPLFGRGIARYGPRPIVMLGAAMSASGFGLLLLYHATYLQIVLAAIPTFTGLVGILVAVTNVIAMGSRHGDSGIQMGMTEMFQDLGSSVGPVVVAAFLATFTRTVIVPATTVPGGVASIVVPSAAAFDWIFVVGLAVAAVAGVLGALLRNYVVSAEPSHPSPAFAGAEVASPP